MSKSPQPRTMTDHAIKAKTGKTWQEWFDTLDAAGGLRKRRKELVQYLAGHYLLPRWWQQMIAASYEQARAKAPANARRAPSPPRRSPGRSRPGG